MDLQSTLTREYNLEELKEPIDELITEDEAFREQYAVPHPDVVTIADLLVGAHENIYERWEDLSELCINRRDIRIPRRTLERTEAYMMTVPAGEEHRSVTETVVVLGGLIA